MSATGNEVATLSQLKQYVDSVVGSGSSVLDVYPVGSIYMSVNSAPPSTLFGGTWEQIKDRFLLAAGSSYSAGGTGGEKSHTLTVEEMPSHMHSIDARYMNSSNYKGYVGTEDYVSRYGQTAQTQATGGGAAHNNMPPYLTVYVWKRTA